MCTQVYHPGQKYARLGKRARAGLNFAGTPKSSARFGSFPREFPGAADRLKASGEAEGEAARGANGVAGEISAPLDVLAAIAGLGGAGRLAGNLAGISERIERSPATEVERVDPGRQFRPGQKGGAGVGKTKRGKGTKWMVVVDGQGVPLGDHLHSASSAEVRLAETTLAAIRVGRRHRAGRPRQKPIA